MPAKPPEDSASGQGKPKGAAKEKPCPICGKPATEASKPFCSERCRDVDLNRWLSGSYVIPAASSDDENAE
jgi:endogenous inhibitor of DNA gyrase (YacG/DUF329 family)